MKASEYVGVSFKKQSQKWVSNIRDKGILYSCGSHDTEREAAKSRDLKILKLNLDKPLQVLTRAKTQ